MGIDDLDHDLSELSRVRTYQPPTKKSAQQCEYNASIIVLPVGRVLYNPEGNALFFAGLR